MGMSGDTALIQAKKYVKKTLQGQGALKGQDGFSPTVKENPSNTDNDYRLDITDKNGTITTPNLKGADGSGSDYKQLKNKPSINGVEIDGNKTLDDLGIQQKIDEINRNIVTEKSERKAEIDVERKRIDNIIALPEGSTTSDAELADIRVGANGTIYESAGESVRGQISELKSDLVDLENTTTHTGGRITKDITNLISWKNGRYLSDGTYDSNDYYKNTGHIKCDGGDKFSFVSSLNSLEILFYNGVEIIGTTGSTKSFTVVDGATSVIISFVSSSTITSVKQETDYKINNALEYVYSTNLFDRDNFKTGKAMRQDGVLVDYDGGYTDYIPVKENDFVIFGDGYNAIRYVRYVTAYDNNYNILSDKGLPNGGNNYTVPSGVSFIRLSIGTSNIKDDSRINISNELLRYEPYKKELLAKGESENRNRYYDEKYRPYSTFDKKKLNGDSYKPMGKLSKPYFCLVSDDGYEGVATYSIPMVISKNIPMTFGIMKGSPVLQEPYLTTLKDAIGNHGCTVAQHGFTRYTEFTEAQLNSFFDDETDYFESIGLEIKGAICPGHNISKLVSAVAGNRYGVLRTGYNGNGETDAVIPHYGWYMNDAKSNLYAMDCYGISSEPLEDQKAHIDDAIENNRLIIGFYHEWELTDETKAQVEAVIDYAIEKGMTFCTLDEIPHLI